MAVSAASAPAPVVEYSFEGDRQIMRLLDWEAATRTKLTTTTFVDRGRSPRCETTALSPAGEVFSGHFDNDDYKVFRGDDEAFATIKGIKGGREPSYIFFDGEEPRLVLFTASRMAQIRPDKAQVFNPLTWEVLVEFHDVYDVKVVHMSDGTLRYVSFKNSCVRMWNPVTSSCEVSDSITGARKLLAVGECKGRVVIVVETKHGTKVIVTTNTQCQHEGCEAPGSIRALAETCICLCDSHNDYNGPSGNLLCHYIPCTNRKDGLSKFCVHHQDGQ